MSVSGTTSVYPRRQGISQTKKVNLRQLFDLSLIGRRDRVALEWQGAEYTFGEIDTRSSRMARALRDRGIAQGDRVCVYLSNRIELIDLFLACMKLGAIFVPINILYRDREMAHILSDAEPKLLVTEKELPELLASGPLLAGDGERALSDGRASLTSANSQGADNRE